MNRSAASTASQSSRRDPPKPLSCSRRSAHSLQYATSFVLLSLTQTPTPCPTLLFMAVGCKIESKDARSLSIGHYLHFFGTIPNPTIVKNRTSDSARILREVGEVPFPDVQAAMSTVSRIRGPMPRRSSYVT